MKTTMRPNAIPAKFISKGEKEWVGTRNEILTSNNKKLNDFIFANKLYAQMKNGK